MKAIRKLTTAATPWLAALVILVAAPTAARAQDCASNYIACISEKGSSTECLHDYIACLAGAILDF